MNHLKKYRETKWFPTSHNSYSISIIQRMACCNKLFIINFWFRKLTVIDTTFPSFVHFLSFVHTLLKPSKYLYWLIYNLLLIVSSTKLSVLSFSFSSKPWIRRQLRCEYSSSLSIMIWTISSFVWRDVTSSHNDLIISYFLYLSSLQSSKFCVKKSINFFKSSSCFSLLIWLTWLIFC